MPPRPCRCRPPALPFLAALAVLAGCAGPETMAVPAAPSGAVTGADWTAPRTVTIRLDEYAFAPRAIAFDREVPYRLVLENVGDRMHSFTAKGFFDSIAARRLVTPRQSVEAPAIADLELGPGETMTLEFVPVAAGTFPLVCAEPLHDLFGMVGTITIR